MNEVQTRATIEYFFWNIKPALEIQQLMHAILGETCPSHAAIQHWLDKYRNSKSAKKRFAAPFKPGINEPIIERVQQLALSDGRLLVKEIAKAISISRDDAFHVLHVELDLLSLQGRWVPRLLSADQKRARVQLAQQAQKSFKKRRQAYITVDDCWLYLYKAPPTHSPGGEEPPKLVKSTSKVHLILVWDAQGVVLVDFLDELNRTFEHILTKVENAFAMQRRIEDGKKFLLHLGNAPLFTSAAAQHSLKNSCLELLPQPLYSPDLSPSNILLFPKLKSHLAAKQCQTKQQLVEVVTAFFEQLDVSVFVESLEKLEQRWVQCIEGRGGYVEK